MGRDPEGRAPICTAINYSINQRDRLQLILEDARIPIHNKSSESRLRVVALGRRNFLFSGHPRAGRNLCGPQARAASRPRPAATTGALRPSTPSPAARPPRSMLMVPEILAHSVPEILAVLAGRTTTAVSPRANLSPAAAWQAPLGYVSEGGGSRTMGMFDWYEPAGVDECPLCRSLLGGWQGKEGPCGLYVFRQGHRIPIEQRVDPGSRGLDSVMLASRLPEGTCEIYCECERGHDWSALATVRDGVWTDTRLTLRTYPHGHAPARWRMALEVLSIAPRAIVACPECADGELAVEDAPDPSGITMRWARCARCRAVDATPVE
ncbi:MAG: transposase [Deltaproteobacteria bacterium]|nr:transposase [Deltaproteobacteria bacterium]